MYQAIVFLPLARRDPGGLIALAGARARFPARARRRRGRQRGRPWPASWRAGASMAAASFIIRITSEDAHEPAAAGSRTAELITTTLLLISMILSWIAFVQVGFGHHDVRVPIFTWMRPATSRSTGRCASTR